jgi:hypothetical protein
MANKARKYTSAESLGVDTSALATDTTKVTLTFTPDASSTYLYIWSCDVAGSGITLDSIVSLKNNAGTVLSTTNHESKDLTADWATLSGIAFETFGASPTSQSVTLTWRAETTSLTSSIRNARVVAIKLNSTDAYVENTADVTNATTTLATATTLTFTPPSTGNYLILGSCETKTPALTASVISQITYNSTAYSAATNTPNDITNYISGLLQASVGSLTATSKTITLDFARVAGTGTVNCRNARLVALRLDEFTDSSITTNNTLSNTTSTSYVEQSTTGTFNTSTGLDYLVIGTASIAGSSIVLSVGHGLRVGLSTYISESFQESTLAGTVASAHFGAFDVFTATNAQSVSFDHYAETSSTTSTTDEVTLSVLLLESTELYWVGGTGTWDGSTATKWAATSGGTGGAAVPKIGTNVFFDSASDSAAPFTVTVSTGAVCNNLTASGLDQTMTLSGSTAMSIYGNLSVPATNFTQSYTGTITFAGTGNETITTNGKTFTAFTFDGVGGTFTLQDALTLTGAATLTRGGLSLSSYTFTCSTFSSNNANGRTISFGTGKFVITSSSTETVWNTATITNLTIDASGGDTLVELTGGGATIKTISAGALPETVIVFPNIYPSSISFSLLNTAGTVAFTASNTVRNLTIANNSFTLSNIAITIYGNLSVGGTSPTLTAGANAWTFASTSGTTRTITTNGDTLDFPITFNGTGGTWQLQDALTVGTSTSRQVTLTAGTLDLNSYSLTVFGIFNSSGTTTRRIQMSGSGGKIVLSLNTATTVWQTVTSTNLTTDGNVLVQLTGGGATTKTISTSTTLSEANAISFQISATAGTVAFTTSNYVKNLTLDSTGFTLSNIAITIYGNAVIGGAGATMTGGGNNWTFAATSGTKTITTNARTIDFPLTFNGIGGTWQLQDALTHGAGATARTLTLTNGTLDLNEYTLTIFGGFSSTNTNTRTVDFGTTGKIVLAMAGATLTTIWNTQTGTNLTIIGNNLVEVVGAGTLSRGINASQADIASTTFNFSILTTAGIVTNFGRYNNLTYNCTNTTVSGSPSLFGNLTMVTTVTSSSGQTTMIGSNGTITSNGNTIPFSIIIDTVGGTTTLNDALTLLIADSGNGALTLTNGTLNLNNFTATLNRFSSTNTNTRSIAFGTSGKILVRGTNDTTNSAIYMDTMDGFSFSGTSNIEANITTAAVTQRIRMGITSGATESNVMNFTLTGTLGTQQLLGSFNNITLNTDAIFTTNTTALCYGNFNHVKVSLTASSGSVTFASTIGTKTITSNGQTILYPIIFDGVGGTWQLQDALSVGNAASVTVTLTNGTLDLNSYTMTIFGIFSSSNSNTRRIQTTGSGGKIVLSLNTATTVWSTPTVTNMTTDGNILVQLTGGGAVVKTISVGTLSEANSISFQLSNTAGTATFTASDAVKNLTIDNNSFTVSNIALTIYGNLTISGTTPTLTAGTNIWTFAATSGTKIITTNAETIVFPITFNGVGGTWQLQDALTMNSSRVMTLTNGTFNLNNFTCTAAGGFAVTGTDTKVLAHGSGDLVISLAGATAFNATGSNLTSTGTGKISMTAATAKTFVGNGNSYATLNQGGVGALTITGSNTFKNITNSTQPASVLFTAGTTNTFTNDFDLNGTSGNLITIGSVTPASTFTLSKSSGTVDVSFCSISDSIATGGAEWYAGTTSTNGGNNTGWLFTNFVVATTSTFLAFFFP